MANPMFYQHELELLTRKNLTFFVGTQVNTHLAMTQQSNIYYEDKHPCDLDYDATSIL